MLRFVLLLEPHAFLDSVEMTMTSCDGPQPHELQHTCSIYALTCVHGDFCSLPQCVSAFYIISSSHNIDLLKLFFFFNLITMQDMHVNKYKKKG